MILNECLSYRETINCVVFFIQCLNRFEMFSNICMYYAANGHAWNISASQNLYVKTRSTMWVHKNTSYSILERIKTCLFLPFCLLAKDSSAEFRDCFIVIHKEYKRCKGAFLYRPSRNIPLWCVFTFYCRTNTTNTGRDWTKNQPNAKGN